MLDTWTKAAPTLLLLLVFTGCSDSPSSPESRPVGNPMVNGAEVWVSGFRVEGVVSLGTGDPSLFRIHASSPAGPASLRRVVMEYSQPGPNHRGGPMMGGFQGRSSVTTTERMGTTSRVTAFITIWTPTTRSAATERGRLPESIGTRSGARTFTGNEVTTRRSPSFGAEQYAILKTYRDPGWWSRRAGHRQ